MDNGDFTSEEKLILGLKKGEPSAYEKIYRDALPTIKVFVHLNNGREDDILDILQEAIIVLYRKLQQPDFVLTCKATTYIYAVCRNKWLNYLRSRKTNSGISDISKYDQVQDDLPDEEQTQRDKQLQEAFDQLDPKCQQILIKYYFYSQSLDEITKSLQLPNVNAAKVKKCRCIQKLKEYLQQNYGCNCLTRTDRQVFKR